MVATEIKNNIQKLLLETEDVAVLQQIEQYFKALLDDSYDWWEELSTSEKVLVDKGVKEIEQGEYIINEAMRAKMKTYFEQKMDES